MKWLKCFFFLTGDPVKAAVVQNLLGNLPTKRKATVIGECETCSVIFNSTEQEAMHMNGKRHAKKMKSAVGGGEWCYVKISEYEPRCEKTGLRYSNQVQHKPGCTIKVDGEMLEIWDLESRGIVLDM